MPYLTGKQMENLDYDSARKILDSHDQHPVRINKNTEIYYSGQDHPEIKELKIVGVRLHGTTIVWLYSSGDVMLNMDDIYDHHWNTVTTRRRMNQFLSGTPWSVHTVKGDAILFHSTGEKFNFVSGVIVSPDGRIRHSMYTEFGMKRE